MMLPGVVWVLFQQIWAWILTGIMAVMASPLYPIMEMAPEDLSTPQVAVRSMLTAVHDLNGYKIYGLLAREQKEELDKAFEQMKSQNQLSTLAASMDYPQLAESIDARDFVRNLFNAVKHSKPDEVKRLQERLSPTQIELLIARAEIKREGDKVEYILPDGLGKIKLVMELGQWRVDNIDNLDLFDF